ncbi:S-adenosyl-L-methionine-dependent methyltransferase [Mycena haematopus]|nr:S-adenosyl-L-methionine-dependent methyltransferase [Mycena haematopus]
MSSPNEADHRPHDAARLDAMHEAFTQYFGGKLGLAPLDDVRPSKILEVGCGSGAWAIQAATLFPDAQVVAVDRAPVPDRTFPANLHFQIADLAKELHSTPRLLPSSFLSSVPNPTNVLHRVSRLVKPGGLLLIEEPDLVSFAESGGPATRRFIYKIKEIQEAGGVEVQFGRNVEGVIGSLGGFEDVRVRRVGMPFGGKGPDEALNKLGLAMKQTVSTASGGLARRFSDQGLTLEVVREYNEEQERSDNQSAMDMYICWARRSVK